MILFKAAAAQFHRIKNTKKQYFRTNNSTVINSMPLSLVYGIVCKISRKHYREPPTIISYGPQPCVVISAPGMMNWDSISPHDLGTTDISNESANAHYFGSFFSRIERIIHTIYYLRERNFRRPYTFARMEHINLSISHQMIISMSLLQHFFSLYLIESGWKGYSCQFS